jgi:hypothetical protein
MIMLRIHNKIFGPKNQAPYGVLIGYLIKKYPALIINAGWASFFVAAVDERKLTPAGYRLWTEHCW